MRRLLTPSGFFLALLCFVLPFATVSCAPSNYGHAKGGGTTTYTGVDLVIGGAPKVTPPEYVAPEAAWKADRLHPQPLAAGTASLLILGAILWLALGARRVRYPIALLIAGLATLTLLANQSIVEHLLQNRVKTQVPLPVGKAAGEYVHTGSGFGFVLLTLVALIIGNLIGWLRRPKPARATPIPFKSRRTQRARGEAVHAARIAARSGNTGSVAPVVGEQTGTPPAGFGYPPPAVPADDRTTAPHHPQPGVDPWPDAPV